MERDYSCRGRVLTPVTILLLTLMRPGQAARCWECDRTNSTLEICDRNTDPPYAPEVVVDEHFCKNIRKNDISVSALCGRHPKGYQLYCELDDPSLNKICNHGCPVKAAPSAAQRGNGAMTHDAPDFPFFVAASVISVIASVRSPI